MHAASNWLVAIAIGAVFIVLVLGVINMLRSPNDGGNRSQTLMRWRVGLQFTALLVILGVLWFRGG